MIDVVVVSVPELKNIYYLSANSFHFKLGDSVIFETNNGISAGIIVKTNYFEKVENLIMPLNKVLRFVSSSDRKIIEKNKSISEKALCDAKKYGNSLGLDMHFVDSYFNFDNSQLLLSFVSDSRIDFRDLAKKLAQKYKTRIELRQIGVRDKAKKTDINNL